MNLITITRDWPIRMTRHKVLYRESFDLTDLDSIILSYLEIYNDTIDYKVFGLMLGFSVDVNNQNELIYDKAEDAIFSNFLNSLIRFHLITIIQNQGNVNVVTTKWGRFARESKTKYLYHEGSINLHEHHQLSNDNTDNAYFEFTKYGIKSQIINSKEIDPIEIDVNTNSDDLPLRNAITNFEQEGSGPKVEILWVESEPFQIGKLNSKLSLTLTENASSYSIITALNDIQSSELDQVIKKSDNSELYNDWMEMLLYEHYMNSVDIIRGNELLPYMNHIDWSRTLSDKRIVWDSHCLNILSDHGVANSFVWSLVSLHCSENIIIENISEYSTLWDWPRLSKRLNIQFIISTINLYPWDIDNLLQRTSQIELESFLTLVDDYSAIDSWQEITNRLSKEFIKSNLRQIPFDLHTIVQNEEAEFRAIVLSNLDLGWSWLYISSTWPLSFLSENIDSLSPYLDATVILSRILRNFEDFEQAFQSEPFERFIIDQVRKSNFKVGKDQNYVLNETTLKHLHSSNLLFWGNEVISGVEANPNLKWTIQLFENYSSLIKSKEGFSNVSRSIENVDAIAANKTFPWDFDEISDRSDLNWSFDFLQEFKELLTFERVLLNVPSHIISENLIFFIEWAEELSVQNTISNFVSQHFSFDEIFNNKVLLVDKGINADWSKSLKQYSDSQLGALYKSISDQIDTIPSPQNFMGCISSNCDLDFILENSDLPWDWILITGDRLEKELLMDEDFQIQYASCIYWPIVIERFYTGEDLAPTNKLTSLAVLISQHESYVREEAWRVITRKIPPNELWKYIKETTHFELFTWDWHFISSSRFIPIDHDFLSTYSKQINWRLLSSNSALATFFQYSELVYLNRERWLTYVSEYLRKYEEYWDFVSLSSINNLTWNERIVSEFEEKWNWHIISSQSQLLTTVKNERKYYDPRRVRKFADRIDWEALSSRSDVILTLDLVNTHSSRPWNWALLSAHPKFEITTEYLLSKPNLPWDYKALSSNKQLKIDKELVIQLADKDWDFQLFSNAKWVDNDVILSFAHKAWDWKVLSSRNDLIFDINLLALFAVQKEIDWLKVLSNNSLHITTNSVGLLNKLGVLDEDYWQQLSRHGNLNFVQNPELLELYKDKWDWNSLIECNKMPLDNIDALLKYRSYLDWEQICHSDNFKPTSSILEAFKDQLRWKVLSRKISLGISELRLFKQYLDWKYLSQNTLVKFSTEVIDEFQEYWDYYYLKDNIGLSPDLQRYVSLIIKRNPELDFYLKIKSKQSTWSGYIYHFTHITNATQILLNRKILSRNKATHFADAAGDVVARRHTAHDFARFYFRPQTPTQYYNECLGLDIDLRSYESALRLGLPKCPIPVFFRFNLQEVILKWKNKCYVSNGNMQTNWAECRPLSEMIHRFNFEDIFSTISKTSDGDFKTYINYSQQEFLIKDEFDFTSIIDFDIIVRNETDKQELIKRIGENNPYAQRIITSDYGDEIFHNRNKDIYCEYADGTLKLRTNYKGNGYKSGFFVLEFPAGTKYELLDGSVISASESQIFVYPRINILFLNSPQLRVYFQDEIKNIKWELYHWN